jgi:hypothetical protein
MIQAKQQNPSISEELITGSAGSPPLSMRHVGFARPLAFAAEKGKPIMVEAGLYRVEASDDGRIVLVSDTGKATPVPTVKDWHDQVVDAPVALDVEREDEHALVLLLPGGVALHSSGSYGQVREAHTPVGTVQDLTTFYEGIFKLHKLKYGGLFNPNIWTLNWGKVLPTTPAVPFVPAGFPPNWVSTKVATCEAPPTSSYGPQAGTQSGNPPFRPGDVVLRGPFKDYYVSTTDVTTTFSSGLTLAGKTVELLVTAQVVWIGYPTIVSMTWQDTYRIVPSANGPVTFPGVVLVTGRTSGDPPAGTTWPAALQEWLYSSSGLGVPTVFELRVDGVILAQQTFFYFASYSGGPPPEIRP